MTGLAELFDLKGQVAIVTGGSRGLGLQVARALGQYGATIALVARKLKPLAAACAELETEGIVAHCFDCDLSQKEATEALTDRILDKLGRVDILVNNAGATWGAPTEAYPLHAWDKVIDLNVTSVFQLTKEVASRAFLPQGHGVVINLASIAGILGHHPKHTPTVAYNASKGAVISMTRALAAEWGPRNIRVNALAPGFFATKMTAGTLDSYGGDLIAQTPRGELGGPCDLMGAALLLSSRAGAHIIGQTIVIDGGASII